MSIIPSVRNKDARNKDTDVEEIKLKETPSKNNRKSTSIAKALKKRISLTRLTNRAEKDKDKEIPPCTYPTFTIEDWEETEKSFADSLRDDYKDSFSFKDDYKDTLSFKDDFAASEDDKTDVEDNDCNIFDEENKKEEDDENDRSDFSDVMSESSVNLAREQAANTNRAPSSLTVGDQSMIIGGKARFYKRLSICDLKVCLNFMFCSI